MATELIKVPDLGGAKDAVVLEVFVRSGNEIFKDQAIITLEGEKATMEIPSPCSGKVVELQVKLGDKVSEGDPILLVETLGVEKTGEIQTSSSSGQANGRAEVTDTVIKIPDLGGAKDASVIEVLIKPGDEIKKDQSILTLEGEKATMEIPASCEGKVKKLLIKVGDKVSQGQEAILIESVISMPTSHQSETKDLPIPSVSKQITEPESDSSSGEALTIEDIYAGPAVRRFARELGVDLNLVKGTGRKKRIILEDVQRYVKDVMQNNSGPSRSSGFSFPSMPEIDFTKFGEIEYQSLTKIKKLTGQNTHRSWITIPHVTQFDEADITELEAFRESYKKEAEQQGFKLTPLVFIMKAVVAALKKFPTFNSSLSVDGEQLIIKKYYHLGVAADTPNGLVVPVIRDVDKKGLFELANELALISKKAREKGLSLNEMQGSCFTISSLGGIGGTGFTPIVNAPDVAILGVSKAQLKPIYINNQFVPRLMLPLSLSYDHRVIDGAEAARFTAYLTKVLSDVRQLLF